MASKPLMPRDADSEPIQTLAPDVSNGTTVTATTTSQNIAVSGVIRVSSENPLYVNFGNSGVTASSSDMYFPAGVEVFKVPDLATHIAVVSVSGTSIVSVTPMV